MKKALAIFGILVSLMACNSEPKFTQPDYPVSPVTQPTVTQPVSVPTVTEQPVTEPVTPVSRVSVVKERPKTVVENHTKVVYVNRPVPPTEIVEVMPVQPTVYHYWTPGYWYWSGYRYTWSRGYYRYNPYRYHAWGNRGHYPYRTYGNYNHYRGYRR